MEFSFNAPAWRMICVSTVVGMACAFTRSRSRSPRPHWGTVVVPDQHHGGLGAVDGLKQPQGRRDVHHRNFIDHQNVALDWVQRIAEIGMAVETEQSVDGAGLVAHDLSS